MPPYQYMQYPGFVFPHAPIYPVDHRRMLDPRFYAPTWVEPQHRSQHHPQPPGRRETACSEAQTEPSDAISKLMECLDKIRVRGLHGGESRELDSGVASQTSGMFSPGEERKAEKPGDVLPEVPGSGHFQSAAAHGECSQTGAVDPVPQGCWSAAVEDELPLDSSSLHGESSGAAAPAGQLFSCVEKSEALGVQSDTSVAEPGVPRSGMEELLRAASPSPSSSSSTSRSSARKDAQGSTRVSQDENEGHEEKYQILKLPFDGLLPPGGVADGHPSPPAGPDYYVSMRATHERMSVLSPSLDELSSRDEMFSTDLDDTELFPKHAYAGRRLMGVVGVSPKASEEVWLQGPKRCVCACCGKNLAKATGRSKGAPWVYQDEGADSEEDSQYGGGGAEGGGGGTCERPIRVLVRKHTGSTRKPHSVPPRPKVWYKKGPYKDPGDPLDQVEGHAVAAAEAAEMSGELSGTQRKDVNVGINGENGTISSCMKGSIGAPEQEVMSQSPRASVSHAVCR